MSEEEYGTKKLKVEIGRSAELEQLRQEKDAEIKRIQDELDEKKATLEQSALAEAEKEKQTIVNMLNESDLSYEQKQAIENQLDNPANYELVKAMLGVKSTKKHAPYGKSTFLPSNSGGAKDYTELLDELYSKAYYDSSVPLEERKQARQQIDQLFESLIEGRSWEQLKRSKAYDAILKTNVESCPSCGKTLINGATCSCGYDAYSKKHRPKTYQNPLVR